MAAWYSGQPVKPAASCSRMTRLVCSVSSASSSVYYENCDAVRAAGADPIHVGDPGYESHLDRDGDGTGCE